MPTPITVYGDVDQRAVSQLQRCAEAGDAIRGALCADGHVGYSQPIGGAVAYPDHISPSGVGYDIACGNKAARTNVRAEDVRGDLPRIMDEIFERISLGIGRRNDEPVDHEVLDAIKRAEFGEHAVEREMDSPPVLLPTDSELGQSYIAAMSLAGEYAYAGRDTVVDRVLEMLGAQSTYAVHNHHNFAWLEEHFGTRAWVIRKGCTPAFPGQEGFVGATMGEPSVILRGADSDAARELLYSTVHGAGRVMSRTQAAGKMGTRAECSVRDCDFWVRWNQREHARCPDHPEARLMKRRGRIKAGRIDFAQVRSELTTKGIELRGGAADEAPDAYKRLDQVLAAHGDTIEILHRLTPIGVAMAGADTFDPYKD
ncbi:RtcB family protein [Solirubrobacter sp. CPCC 204708]|uniref:3'-phosphate/5'-hydroxy nucleic acid ligase n=1 Tax=Solirubrobacter deserti TaxID=2282478 RepID=A0ABT4RU96_9ACTN|nr:RtcB family protein [Solirubrobacter deserti]MBE2316468.1 RtcB family protein [Solirubrobacter deserti]MDA0142158.1 RtcB family protein [Solirubrobacter deserti]